MIISFGEFITLIIANDPQNRIFFGDKHLSICLTSILSYLFSLRPDAENKKQSAQVREKVLY
jgi:hypothetical protein